MTEKTAKREKAEKLGANSDPLGLSSILERAGEMAAKTGPQQKNPGRPPTDGYVFAEIRGGRPYYYRRYYLTLDGKRVRKKEYLGTELPKGMRIRK